MRAQMAWWLPLTTYLMLLGVGQADSQAVLDREKRFSIPGFKTDTQKSGITTEERDAFLNSHNEKRRETNAANMRLMEWDTDLEAEAQAWADNCDYTRNNGNSYGENRVAQAAVYNETVAVRNWFDEGPNYIYSNNSCIDECENYIQLVWSESSRLGCGIKFCSSLTNLQLSNAYYIVCNYNVLYNVGSVPYEEGAACSACPADAPVCEQSLCRPGIGTELSSSTTVSSVTTAVTATTTASTTPGTGGTTVAVTAGTTVAVTAGTTVAGTAGTTVAVTAGTTVAGTAGTTAAVTAGTTAAVTVGTTVAVTAGTTVAGTAGTTVAGIAGTTVAVTAGTTVAVTAGTTVAGTAGTTVAGIAGTTVAVTAGTTVAGTAGTTADVTAGTTADLTAGTTTPVAARTTSNKPNGRTTDTTNDELSRTDPTTTQPSMGNRSVINLSHGTTTPRNTSTKDNLDTWVVYLCTFTIVVIYRLPAL